jgi:hypothetical protein
MLGLVSLTARLCYEQIREVSWDGWAGFWKSSQPREDTYIDL